MVPGGSEKLLVKNLVVRKVLYRYDLSARLQLSNMFQDIPRRRRNLMILGGRMGLFVFLSVCVKYINTQILSFVLGN